MSVRIYHLSKQVNMTNKELITLLQSRGLKVDSPSNTIPDIYANDLLEEIAKDDTAAPTPAPAQKESKPEPEKPKAPTKPPAGQFIKSAEDIQKEREAKAAPKVMVKSAPAVALKPAATTMVKPAPVPATTAPKPAPAIAGSAPKLPPMPQSKSAPALPKQPAAIPQPAVAQASTAIAEAEQEAPSADLKIITIRPPIVVRDFSGIIGIKPFRLISELMEMGIFASMNQSIEEDIASRIAEKHGFMLDVRHRGEAVAPSTKKPKQPEGKPEKLESRPPVVCVLGHVDHGKTTLLDTLRKTNVVKGEAGGITQHIGAYQVEHKKKKITFIDTPGHAAFSKMRERGANVTDVAILVIAADDGFMPQTKEALKFAQRANVPIVVAINKMDAKGANIDRAKQQMQQNGIAPEDWGGETLCAPVSALKGENMDDLLELVLLQSEMLELKADVNCSAEGTIVESQVEMGRGSTATAIINKGILKQGDAFVCGSTYGKARALIDDKGKNIKQAPPSTPVRILGWAETPEAGATFTVVKNEKEARRLAEENKELAKQEIAAREAPLQPNDIENLFAAIEQVKQKILKVIIKADVHGSAEALRACLEDIKSEKVSLEVIGCDVGLISKNDVITSSAAGATIVGFNTKMENGVSALAKHNDVHIIQHNIIYELIDQVKEAMSELLDPELKEEKLGAAEVRQVFSVSKGGSVAGSMVTEGRISRDAFARLLRKNEVLFEGKIQTLKRFKDDTNEVRAGYECGIGLSGYNDIQSGDTVECFEIKKIRPTL